MNNTTPVAFCGDSAAVAVSHDGIPYTFERGVVVEVPASLADALLERADFTAGAATPAEPSLAWSKPDLAAAVDAAGIAAPTGATKAELLALLALHSEMSSGDVAADESTDGDPAADTIDTAGNGEED